MIPEFNVEKQFKLPWPPSINMAYRAVNNRVIRSEKGRKFQDRCSEILKEEKEIYPDEDLFFMIELFPPSRRKYDVDNYGKVVIDTIPWFADDSQITALVILKGEKDEEKEGYCVVSCGKLNGSEDTKV